MLTMPEVSELTGLSPDSIKRHYGHLIRRMSPRRVAVKLRDALSIEATVDRGTLRPPPSVIAGRARTPTGAPPRPPKPEHAKKTCASEGQTRRRKKLEFDVKEYERGHV
jgi:hypothetical protein